MDGTGLVELVEDIVDLLVQGLPEVPVTEAVEEQVALPHRPPGEHLEQHDEHFAEVADGRGADPVGDLGIQPVLPHQVFCRGDGVVAQGAGSHEVDVISAVGDAVDRPLALNVQDGAVRVPLLQQLPEEGRVAGEQVLLLPMVHIESGPFPCFAVDPDGRVDQVDDVAAKLPDCHGRDLPPPLSSVCPCSSRLLLMASTSLSFSASLSWENGRRQLCRRLAASVSGAYFQLWI